MCFKFITGRCGRFHVSISLWQSRDKELQKRVRNHDLGSNNLVSYDTQTSITHDCPMFEPQPPWYNITLPPLRACFLSWALMSWSPKSKRQAKENARVMQKKTEDRPEKPHGTNEEHREHTRTEGTGMGHAGTKTDEWTNRGWGNNTGLKTANKRDEGLRCTWRDTGRENPGNTGEQEVMSDNKTEKDRTTK